MKIVLLPRFEREFKRLPTDIKKLAETKEKLFRVDPFDPRLKTHKLHGEMEEFWSFSLNYKYRVIFTFQNEATAIFYSIGSHDIY